MAHIEFNTRFGNLIDEHKNDLVRWRHNVNHDEGPVGLWVYGKRGSGSSYIAKCALHKMVVDHFDWDWEYFTAKQVMDAQRNLWMLSRQLGPNADIDLLQEHMLIDQEFRFLWDKAQIIMLDDLFDSLDTGFWRSHIHDDIDRRVKERRATIIATTMAPSHRVFEEVQHVIEDLFVIVNAAR
jgi:hypothetical protein